MTNCFEGINHDARDRKNISAIDKNAFFRDLRGNESKVHLNNMKINIDKMAFFWQSFLEDLFNTTNIEQTVIA
jgi:hypothetical protein